MHVSDQLDRADQSSTFPLRIHFSRLDIPRESHARTSLPSRLLVQRDIVVQLLLLLGNLSGIAFALRLLDLQRGRLQKQLEHLVLDLAVLQRRGGTAARRRDGTVEGVSLGRLGCLAGGLEDCQVASGD
jgi:hypothetical protein